MQKKEFFFKGWGSPMPNLKTRNIAFIMKVMAVWLISISGAAQLLASSGYSQGKDQQRINLNYKRISLAALFEVIEKKADVVIMYENTAAVTRDDVDISVRNKKVADILDQVLQVKKLKWSILGNVIRVEKREPSAMFERGSPFFPAKDTAVKDITLPTVTGKVLTKDGAPVSGATVNNQTAKKSTISDREGRFSINANTGDVIAVSFVGYLAISVRIVQGSNGTLNAVVVKAERQSSEAGGDGYDNSKAPSTGKLNTSSIIVSSARQPFSLVPGEDKNNSAGDGKSAENNSSRGTGHNGGIALTVLLLPEISSLNTVVVTALGMEKSTKELGYSVTKVSGEELNRTNPGNLLTGLTGKVSGLSVATQSPDMNPQMRVLLRGIRSISNGANNMPLIVLNGSPLSFGSSQYAATLALDFVNNINPSDIEDVTILKGTNGATLYGPEGVNGVILITTKKGNKGGKTSFNFQSSATFQQVDFRNLKTQQEYGPGKLINGSDDPVYDPTGQGGWGPKFNGEQVEIGRPDEAGNIQKVPYQFTKERRRFWDVGRMLQQNLSISGGDARSDFFLGLNYTDQTGILPKDKKTQTSLLLNTGRQMGKLGVRLTIGYARNNMDQGPPISSMENIPAHIPVTRYKDYQNDHWSDPDHYYSDYMLNVYNDIGRARTKSTTNALFGNLELQYKPFEWITIKNRLGINYLGSTAKTFKEPVYFSDFARPNGPIRFRDLDASLKEEMNTQTSINQDLFIQTSHKLGSFTLKTISGNTIRDNYYKIMTAEARNLAVPVPNLDFNQYPPAVVEKSELTRFISFFGEVTGGYKDKVFLAFGARNDWDSKLTRTARRKNIYFGSNASFVLTEIFPVLKVNWLDQARLRASVVKSANMNVAPYQFERILTRADGFPYGKVIGYDFGNDNPNPNLQPERVISKEFGLSVSVLKKRIELDVSYYNQRTNGMILEVSASQFSSAPKLNNVGKFSNFGWEFDLTAKPIQSEKGFSLDLGFRLSINDNKILELSNAYGGELNALQSAGLTNYSAVGKTGDHAYAFKVFDWQKDPQGRVIVDRNTGMPSVDYQNPVILGRSLPKYVGGMNAGASWKKLTINITAEFNANVNHFFEGGAAWLYNGMHPLTTYNDRKRFVFPNSVYKDSDGKFVENKDIKVMSANSNLYQLYAQASRNLLVDGAFFKIREVAIGYEFTLRKNPSRKLVAGIYGRDLFTFLPGSNIFGDPQLIKGPGYDRANQILNQNSNPNQESNRDNTSGSRSGDNRIPGTVLYGLRINLKM